MKVLTIRVVEFVLLNLISYAFGTKSCVACDCRASAKGLEIEKGKVKEGRKQSKRGRQGNPVKYSSELVYVK